MNGGAEEEEEDDDEGRLSVGDPVQWNKKTRTERNKEKRKAAVEWLEKEKREAKRLKKDIARCDYRWQFPQIDAVIFKTARNHIGDRP